MATKNAAPPKKDNSGAIIAGVAVAGTVGIVALLLTKGAKAAPAGPTAVFIPSSGTAGTVITVNGTGWSPGETVLSVSIGNLTAVNTLAVDSAGKLTGTITLPTIMKGKWAIIITGSVSGPLSYAFTVSSGTWAVLGSTTLAVPVGTAYPTGWITVTSTTLTVPFGTAYPVGWITVTSTTLTVPVAPSYPVGWITVTGTTLVVTHIPPNPVGWIPLASTALVVQRVVYVPQMVVSPTTIASGQSITWTFYNFTPMASVSVFVVGGGGLNVNANALGSGTGSFTVQENPGNYTLQATDNYGKSATASFTITARPTAILTVSANNENDGFVEVEVNGATQPFSGSYNIPIGAQVILTAYPLSNNQFSSWWDSTGQYTGSKTSSITISNWAAARGFVATFVSAPPPSGPQFPAPTGDTEWYWVVFLDGSAAWFDQSDYVTLIQLETIFLNVYGAYVPGATS